MPPPLNSALQAVAAGAIADLEPLWQLTAYDLAPAMMDVLPGAVDEWSMASAAAAADWYDELRDTENIGGRFAAIVEPMDDLGGEALAGWAAEPLRGPEPDIAAARYRAEGGLQKRMVNSANRTVTYSSTQDPNARGYMRKTRPGACKFCIMVASRGAVYTQASARFACHEHCYCVAVPAWGGRELPVGPYKPSDRPMTPQDRARVKKWIDDNLSDTPPPPRRRRGKESAPERDFQAPPRDLDADTNAWLDAEDVHKHSVDYWRRVDAEDLHSIPARDLEAPVPAITETPMDRAARELDEAIASGDDARIDAAAATLEKLEDTERRAAQKAARAAERKAAKANVEAAEIVRLIDEQGYDPVDAEATVTGKSVESIRRRDFIAQARADGHRGAGFDDLVTSVHQRMVDELVIEAENATNGYMVKSKYQLTVNSKSLWLVNDATARKWMSDEMAEWFDQHGRLTRPVLRQMALDGQYSLARFAAQGQDYLQ